METSEDYYEENNDNESSSEFGESIVNMEMEKEELDSELEMDTQEFYSELEEKEELDNSELEMEKEELDNSELEMEKEQLDNSELERNVVNKETGGDYGKEEEPTFAGKIKRSYLCSTHQLNCSHH